MLRVNVDLKYSYDILINLPKIDLLNKIHINT